MRTVYAHNNLLPADHCAGVFHANNPFMQPNDSVSRAGVYVDRWNLSDPVLIAETATSWIYKVARKKGGAAALKLLKPETNEDERLGGQLLNWYAGEGAARVYAQTEDATLLEWLNGHALSELVHQGKDVTATDIICQIVSQLHQPRQEMVPELIPLNARFAALFDTNMSKWPFAGRDLLIRAKIIAKALLETVEEEIPLHGDLHHDNILFSPRSWVAIDPKGILGDPAYEVANCFQTPWTATDVCADPGRINRLADTFEQRLGFNKARMLGFAVSHTALSACWSVAAGHPVMHQLAILPRLISAHERESKDLFR